MPAAWAGRGRRPGGRGGPGRPGPAVAALHQAWAGRGPVVVELARRPRPVPPAPVVWRPPLELAAGFELGLDRLHFLVWANTYDARGPTPARSWWWARKAARLRASTELADEVAGDVRLPDGSAAWIDGGPRPPLAGRRARRAGRHPPGVGRARPADRAPPPAGPEPTWPPTSWPRSAHRAGPARIIAPAGSGKTRVLTERLPPPRWWTAASSATPCWPWPTTRRPRRSSRPAAPASGPGCAPSTRSGYALLSEARGAPPRVLDEREARRLDRAAGPDPPPRANTDPIGPYLEALGQVRLGLRRPRARSRRGATTSPVWPSCLRALPGGAARAPGPSTSTSRSTGRSRSLLADGGFRRQAQAGCRHLLVDEFQDLTPAHVLLIRLLAAPGLDVFGVGDDDQVIYGHAGADPAFLIGFERLFPGAGDHPLEVNYRCPVAVVEAAVQPARLQRAAGGQGHPGRARRPAGQ